MTTDYTRKKLLRAIFQDYEALPETKKRGISRFLELKPDNPNQEAKQWLRLKEYQCSIAKLKEWIIDSKVTDSKGFRGNIDCIVYYTHNVNLVCVVNETKEVFYYYYGSDSREKTGLEEQYKIKLTTVYPVEEVATGHKVIKFNLSDRPDIASELKPRKTNRRKFN